MAKTHNQISFRLQIDCLGCTDLSTRQRNGTYASLRFSRLAAANQFSLRKEISS